MDRSPCETTVIPSCLLGLPPDTDPRSTIPTSLAKKDRISKKRKEHERLQATFKEFLSRGIPSYVEKAENPILFLVRYTQFFFGNARRLGIFFETIDGTGTPHDALAFRFIVEISDDVAAGTSEIVTEADIRKIFFDKLRKQRLIFTSLATSL